MARTRRQAVVVHVIKLWLVPGRDDDIIAFLAQAAPGSKANAVLQRHAWWADGRAASGRPNALKWPPSWMASASCGAESSVGGDQNA